MKLDREGRRTVAQFLTGLAIALLGTLVFTPMAGGPVHAGPMVGASAGASCD